MADLKDLSGVSEKDRQMIADAETLLGQEPDSLGPIKTLFWGGLREDKLFPYPTSDADETARCDELLDALGAYLTREHPAVEIDQKQEMPEWVIRKLFELGVLGMTIPKEYGGGGLGITSYNRVLERIGRSCGSTAVVVSAHQSIGCKAVMLFGTEEQKARWLPHIARDYLSAFCLSEPNVGCDAAGQETVCRKSDDGTHFVLNGEKKWSTSGALAGLFTVMARHEHDAKGAVTALVVTPDMPGVEIFQKNRSKCGIRGTWQARIRFTDVKVPVENLLGQEGKGLGIALTCLNYGRCTLSAGMLGGARRAAEQAGKWVQTRYQFKRPLSDWDLVRQKLARMSAMTYAMDAVLYMTTGMLDRHDDDIRLETAVCKVFCSEMGWRVVNDAVQCMGGEGYVTENEVERIFRDSRINTIVEGANEVMQSYIFAYGARQLAEHMLGVRQSLTWQAGQGVGGNLSRLVRNGSRASMLRAGVPLAAELFLAVKKAAPHKPDVHASLQTYADRLVEAIRRHSHEFKLTARREEEKLVSRQVVQARLADSAMWLHAWACVLSKFDARLCEDADLTSPACRCDRAAAEHFMDLADLEIDACFRALHRNADESMRRAAEATLAWVDTLPDDEYYLPERSPVAAAGSGKTPRQQGIAQFPGDGSSSATSESPAREKAADPESGTPAGRFPQHAGV